MTKKKEKELLKKWSDFHDLCCKDESQMNWDFNDMARGFFCALGATFDEAEMLYEKCISELKKW